MNNDPFYIGYLPKVPAPHASRVRRYLLVVLALVPCIALAAALLQRPIDPGTFEFGTSRTFEGVLYEHPLPMLRLVDRSANPATGAVVNLLLCGSGKHGLPEFARGHDGEKVRFDGTLIFRRGVAMIEMNSPETFSALGPPAENEKRNRVESLGQLHLHGEIVDTKCFLGVMRPATGKVHRACAIRCLSGGIPPGLWVRDAAGNEAVFLLAGRDGTALELDLQLAGLAVEVTGTAEVHDGMPVLRVKSLRPL